MTESTPRKQFPQAVREQLAAEIGRSARYNKKSLAEASGMAYSTMLNYLSGKRQMSLETLDEVLTVLGVDANAFMARVKLSQEQDS